jgi:hypothetical protein
VALDAGRSRVILGEVNAFGWPGFDLRPVPGAPGTFAYRFMPLRHFSQLKLDEVWSRGFGKATPRDGRSVCSRVGYFFAVPNNASRGAVPNNASRGWPDRVRHDAGARGAEATNWGRRSHAVADMTKDEIEQMAAPRMSSGHDHLNSHLDEA